MQYAGQWLQQDVVKDAGKGGDEGDVDYEIVEKDNHRKAGEHDQRRPEDERHANDMYYNVASRR